MTDHDRLHGSAEGRPCGFEAQRAPYLRGALDDAASEAFEAHVATCASCESVIEPATRVEVASHAIRPPQASRAAVLEAVAQRPHRARRSGAPWIATLMLAAAALAVMIVRRSDDGANDRAPSAALALPTPAETVATEPGLAELTTPPNAMLGTAARLARDPSLAEFRVLDAAARELEAALVDTPDDPDVRAQLDAVRARRAELTDKLKAAAS